jgi:Reverse transcriptase (RNA-dependent DNA polymerase)/Domain of unknown function (DUF6451)
MYQAGKLAEICREMDQMKVEVLGLCETRWNQSGQQDTSDGKLLMYSGMPDDDDDHVYGVGVLLSRKMKANLISWMPISERLMTVRIKGKQRNISIVQGYAPTEDATIETKEEFYSQLDAILSELPKRDVKLLMGDLNARVGDTNENLEHVLGPHGIGRRNENGGLLIELCGNHELKVGGTMFIHRDCHKNTWFSNDHRTVAQLDHICISRRWSKQLLDVRVFRSADVGSDHHLLVATLRLKFQRVPKKNPSSRKKFAVERLKSGEKRTEFSEVLRRKLETDVDESTIDKHWSSLKGILTQTAENVLGYAEKSKKEWMSEATWEIVEKRKAAKQKMCENRDQAKTQELENNFNNLNKAVKRSARKDRRKFLENLAEEAQTAADKGHLSELYKITKTLSQKSTNKQVPVKDKQGKIVMAVEDQLKRWREHFEEILNRPSESEEKLSSRDTPQLRINVNPPTKTEICKALKELKNGKAAGVDNIPAEILKVDTDLTARALLPLFQNIWRNEEFPDDWMEGIIVKIPKKGDLSECKNWRGINLLCMVSKAFTRIILNRILDVLEQTIRKQQAGFRTGKSCVDHINTLRLILEQSAEWNATLYALFVDYEVAFDSVDRDSIWIALKNRGVPDKIINLIKKLYDGFKCRVLHNGQQTDPFITISGVRQGCLLSPLLFLLVLDEVLSNTLDNKRRGILWKLTEVLEDLDYADDIALLSHKHSDMQSKIDDLVLESAKCGLKVNVSKTKDIRINNTSSEPFKINGEQIETVTDFTYLGSNISASGGSPRDVEQRINKARGAFHNLISIWRANNISPKLKIKIFNACVKSVLLYGCETWFVTNEIMSKLQAYVNRCLRYIMKIRWPRIISNQELWKLTDQVDINLEVRRRKYGWIGHTLRKNTDEICHSVLEWNPQGRRKPGRPKVTWRRTVLKECGKQSFGELRVIAKSRVRWRNFADDLCSTRSLASK